MPGLVSYSEYQWGAGQLGIQGGHESWSRVAGPAGARAGTRPMGTAGDTRGWWLQNEATRGAPQLPGGTVPAPWNVDGHREVTPSQPTAPGPLPLVSGRPPPHAALCFFFFCILFSSQFL